MVDIPSPTTEQARTEAIVSSLVNHPPVDDRIVQRFEVIRGAAIELAHEILLQAPNCRERSTALSRLEETVMWSIKAIALHQAAILNAEGLHAGCHEIPSTDFSDRAWEVNSDCSLPHPVG